MRRPAQTLAALAGFAVTPTLLCAQITVPGEIIVKAGDFPAGGGGLAVSTMNSPFTTKTGHVGFTGLLTIPAGGTDGFVFFNNRVVWRNSNSVSPILTGVETTSGVGNGGTFIYSPSADGNDAVWGDDGLILVATTPAPGINGQFSRFNSRPEMTPDGTGYWVGGLDDTPGGGSTNRVLYRHDPITHVITPVIIGGATVGGLTITVGAGVTFVFQVSDNHVNRVNLYDTTAAAATDLILALNDTTILAREGAPTGKGTTWLDFDECGINNNGSWVFAGRDSIAGGSDDVVVYNGDIKLRNLSTIDGVAIGGTYTASGISINNQDEVVFCYRTTADQVLFFGDGPTLETSARRILKTGDTLDAGAGGTWLVNEIKTSTLAAQALDLDDSGFVFVEVDIQPTGGGAEVEAIIKIATGGGCPGDWNGDGVTNSTDVSDLINDWFADQVNGSSLADWNGDGVVNSTDVSDFINAWFGTTGPGCDV